MAASTLQEWLSKMRCGVVVIFTMAAEILFVVAQPAESARPYVLPSRPGSIDVNVALLRTTVQDLQLCL